MKGINVPGGGRKMMPEVAVGVAVGVSVGKEVGVGGGVKTGRPERSPVGVA
jgi:hypothetical protein